ncbi:MAG: hypothetical protein NZ898_02240 [Myxococcota bacterium]|nr:hypothetical protein [Myxococcota bacterium]MDW8361090.1 hypothetical protein [Myxococcales bacterium]
MRRVLRRAPTGTPVSARGAPRRARRPPGGLLTLLALASQPACGGADPALRHARSTVDLAGRVVAEIDRAETRRRPPEQAREVMTALARVEQWLADANIAIARWSEEPEMQGAWEIVAPCLASSLVALRRALERARLPLPSDLEQAHAMASGVSEAPCAGDSER